MNNTERLPQKGSAGYRGGSYKPLSPDDIRVIHESSLRVFAEIGIKVKSDRALDQFVSAGAKVDRQSGMVFMEPDKVMEWIGRAPSSVRLYGRKPHQNLDMDGLKVHAGTGGTALYIINHETGEKRPARLSDLKDISRVVDALDHIHLFMLPVFPSDIPEERVDVNRFGVALAHCSKHIMGGVYTIEGVRNVAKMAAMIVGSKAALQEKPIVSMVTCSAISPLVLDARYSELAMEAAGLGIPVVTPSEPLCGATAPVTLAGNLVVQNVESLAGVILTQTINPGTPVFYGCISTIADMKDMKYLSGAVEMGLMSAAAAQLSDFYKLPIYTTAGMTDSKTLDAQAGYESAVTSVLVALAGGNFLHDAAGLLDFATSVSLEKYVLDNEILGMVMRAVRGIEVNEKTVAFDELKKVGPAGHFVASRHTRKFMRTEHFIPTLSDRGIFEEWADRGRPDTLAAARKRVREILRAPFEPIIPVEIRQLIVSEVPGLEAEYFK